MVASILTGLLAVLIVAHLLLVGYLLVLAVLAITARPTRGCPSEGRRKFAVLVPAHDEEAVLERLLSSLKRLDYPSERVDICVVADNCSDTTADIARSSGARVYERVDTTQQAKGYALRWLLEQLGREDRTYDAFVVVDADSVLAPNFL